MHTQLKLDRLLVNPGTLNKIFLFNRFYSIFLNNSALNMKRFYAFYAYLFLKQLSVYNHATNNISSRILLSRKKVLRYEGPVFRKTKPTPHLGAKGLIPIKPILHQHLEQHYSAFLRGETFLVGAPVRRPVRRLKKLTFGVNMVKLRIKKIKMPKVLLALRSRRSRKLLSSKRRFSLRENLYKTLTRSRVLNLGRRIKLARRQFFYALRLLPAKLPPYYFTGRRVNLKALSLSNIRVVLSKSFRRYKRKHRRRPLIFNKKRMNATLHSNLLDRTFVDTRRKFQWRRRVRDRFLTTKPKTVYLNATVVVPKVGKLRGSFYSGKSYKRPTLRLNPKFNPRPNYTKQVTFNGKIYIAKKSSKNNLERGMVVRFHRFIKSRRRMRLLKMVGVVKVSRGLLMRLPVIRYSYLRIYSGKKNFIKAKQYSAAVSSLTQGLVTQNWLQRHVTVRRRKRKQMIKKLYYSRCNWLVKRLNRLLDNRLKRTHSYRINTFNEQIYWRHYTRFYLNVVKKLIRLRKLRQRKKNARKQHVTINTDYVFKGSRIKRWRRPWKFLSLKKHRPKSFLRVKRRRRKKLSTKRRKTAYVLRKITLKFKIGLMRSEKRLLRRKLLFTLKRRRRKLRRRYFMKRRRLRGVVRPLAKRRVIASRVRVKTEQIKKRNTRALIQRTVYNLITKSIILLVSQKSVKPLVTGTYDIKLKNNKSLKKRKLKKSLKLTRRFKKVRYKNRTIRVMLQNKHPKSLSILSNHLSAFRLKKYKLFKRRYFQKLAFKAQVNTNLGQNVKALLIKKSSNYSRLKPPKSLRLLSNSPKWRFHYPAQRTRTSKKILRPRLGYYRRGTLILPGTSFMVLVNPARSFKKHPKKLAKLRKSMRTFLDLSFLKRSLMRRIMSKRRNIKSLLSPARFVRSDTRRSMFYGNLVTGDLGSSLLQQRAWHFYRNRVALSGLGSSNFITKNIRIRRIRFKPGYSKIWRRARRDIKKSMNIKYKYQSRVTAFLARNYYNGRKRNHPAYVLKLNRVLLSSRLLKDTETAGLFIAARAVYLNGLACLNPNMLVYKSDFIQLIVHNKMYYIFRVLLNKYGLSVKRSAKIAWLKRRKRFYSPLKTRSRLIPDKVLGLSEIFTDIPNYLEVDYLTLSVFVLFEPIRLNQTSMNHTKTDRLNLLNAYNWKYIT